MWMRQKAKVVDLVFPTVVHPSIHPSQLSRVVTSPGLTHRQRQLFTYAQFRITSYPNLSLSLWTGEEYQYNQRQSILPQGDQALTTALLYFKADPIG